MKTLFTAAFLLFSAQLAFAQNYNLGFEDWRGSSQSISNVPNSPGANCSMPANAYSYSSDTALNKWSNNSGFLRTTDAHSGSYAAVVSLWYMHATGLLGFGQCSEPGLPAPIPCKNSFPSKIYGISGYYKYVTDSFVPEDGSSKRKAVAYIKTYKLDPVTQQLSTLTFDSLDFARTNSYQPFQIPIHYPAGNSMPDSVSIWFEAQNKGIGGGGCTNNHFLYLDDLEFHFSSMATAAEPLLRTSFRIFPNPAADHIRLEYANDITVQHIRLMDMLGRCAKTYPASEKQLSTTDLPSGNYLLQITTDKGIHTEKIWIQ